MAAFGVDLASFITIEILPLGLRPPIDPIKYLQEATEAKQMRKNVVSAFLLEFSKALKSVETAGADTGRLMTIYRVRLESVKKISTADLVVRVASSRSESTAEVIERRVDPNVSHPLRQKDVAEALVALPTQFKLPYVIQAVVWKYQISKNIQYCWRSEVGGLTKYSRDFVTFMKKLSHADLQAAVESYKRYMRERASLARVRQ